MIWVYRIEIYVDLAIPNSPVASISHPTQPHSAAEDLQYEKNKNAYNLIKCCENNVVNM